MTYEDFFANAIARSHDERRHRVIAILAQYQRRARCSLILCTVASGSPGGKKMKLLM
jgi:hypothetical protein